MEGAGHACAVWGQPWAWAHMAACAHARNGRGRWAGWGTRYNGGMRAKPCQDNIGAAQATKAAVAARLTLVAASCRAVAPCSPRAARPPRRGQQRHARACGPGSGRMLTHCVCAPRRLHPVTRPSPPGRRLPAVLLPNWSLPASPTALASSWRSQLFLPQRTRGRVARRPSRATPAAGRARLRCATAAARHLWARRHTSARHTRLRHTLRPPAFLAS
jgi:hypothetical protein